MLRARGAKEERTWQYEEGAQRAIKDGGRGRARGENGEHKIEGDVEGTEHRELERAGLAEKMKGAPQTGRRRLCRVLLAVLPA